MKRSRSFAVCSLSLLLAVAAYGESWHASILGNADKDLIKAGGDATSSDAIKGKKWLFIYFSAHWCPPCRVFTPQLVDFYNQHHEKGNFEVLFVSGDHSPKEMSQYMAHAKMPWAGVKLTSAQSDLLKEKFSVQGIPFLVLLDENDAIVSASGYDNGGYNAGKPLEAFAKLQPL